MWLWWGRRVQLPCSEGQSTEFGSTLGDSGEVRDGRNGCASADPSATWPRAVFAAVDNSQFPGHVPKPGQCMLTQVYQFLIQVFQQLILTRDC